MLSALGNFRLTVPFVTGRSSTYTKEADALSVLSDASDIADVKTSSEGGNGGIIVTPYSSEESKARNSGTKLSIDVVIPCLFLSSSLQPQLKLTISPERFFHNVNSSFPNPFWFAP
jgi:hypothetical protein